MTVTTSITNPAIATSSVITVSGQHHTVISSKVESCKKRRWNSKDATKFTNGPQKTRRASFLPCHFKMLKALYSEENFSNQDGLVSEEVWEMIKKYMKHSCVLHTAKKAAANLLGIHQESISFLSTVAQKQQTEQPRVPTRALFSITTQQTPLKCNVFTPPYEQMLQSQGRSSMNVVARLLAGKTAVAQTASTKLAQPYLQLLEAVNGRLEKLKTILEVEKTNQNDVVEIEIKIRLWHMIATDMCAVLKL